MLFTSRQERYLVQVFFIFARTRKTTRSLLRSVTFARDWPARSSEARQLSGDISVSRILFQQASKQATFGARLDREAGGPASAKFCWNLKV